MKNKRGNASGICGHISMLVALLGSVMGCNDDIVGATRVAGAPGAAALAPTSAVAVTYDDDILAVGAAMPGFGGIYVENDTLIVAMQDGFAVNAQRIANLVNKYSVASERDRTTLVTRLRTKAVAFSFAQLAEASLAISNDVFRAGALSLDRDEVLNRVVVGAPKQVIADIVGIVRRKFSSYAAMIDVVEAEPARLATALRPSASSAALTLHSKVRPLIGGLQVQGSAMPGTCTMGFVAKLESDSTPTDPYTYIATNAHCTPDFGSVLAGHRIGQPVSGFGVGVEAYDPPLFDNSANAACPVGHACRYSDVALYRLDDSIAASLGDIARTPVGGFTILSPPHVLRGEAVGIIGETMYKTAATTGLRAGTLAAVCINHVQSPYFRTMLCQNRVNIVGDYGDSGAPIYKKHSTIAGAFSLVGIYWGGTTTVGYVSPIQFVSMEIGSVIGPPFPFDLVTHW